MKHLVSIISIVLIVLALYSLFKAQETAVEKQKLAKQDAGNCLDLDRLVYENPDAAPEEIRRLEDCNRKRTARPGLDKPGTGFLSNTKTHPVGALAHYESRGGLDAFTVYDDYILTHTSSGTGPREYEIAYSRIRKVGLSPELPGTIYIDYVTDFKATVRYTLTLLRQSRIKRARGSRDIDRLIGLIEKQRQVHVAEAQESIVETDGKEGELVEKVE